MEHRCHASTATSSRAFSDGRSSTFSLCRRNKNPQAIPLGKYDVLLEPEAVAELLEWLGYIGFGAKQIEDRTSFMAGRMGEKLMGQRISISDDGSDPEGMTRPN